MELNNAGQENRIMFGFSWFIACVFNKILFLDGQCPSMEILS